MAKMSGTVQKVQTNQEGKEVVLRCKILSDTGDFLTVEMRGNKLCGLLEAGDQVLINCKPDKYGVMHPKKFSNTTTNSWVRVESPGFFSTAIKFLFSTVLSIATGALTNIIVKLLTTGSGSNRQKYSFPNSGNNSDPIPILVSVCVGLLVFYFIFIRPRRH